MTRGLGHCVAYGVNHELAVSSFAVSIALCEQGQPAVSRLCRAYGRAWWCLWALPLHRDEQDQDGQGPQSYVGGK